MIIANSSISFSASASHIEQRRLRESMTLWKDGVGRMEMTAESTQTQVRVMGAALSIQQSSGMPTPARPISLAPAPAPSVATPESEAETVETPAELELALLKGLIERLLGRKLKLFDPKELEVKGDNRELKEIARHSPSEGARNREGWGMIYQRHESYHESETTQVSMQGIVHTADGRKIELSVGLSMSREFMSQNNLSVRAGDALKDPLVINFNGNAAQLTETTFRFDLDADGKAEHIAFVSPDSGFLALDRNGDGKINDGRELFGALSGDGFADLSIADDDGNNWIDESDAIFGRLLIWSRDAEGQETFSTLAERGVGAIYLGSIESPFHLKDSSNALQGIIRSSGLYLHEDGNAGTLQQLDLVV